MRHRRWVAAAVALILLPPALAACGDFVPASTYDNEQAAAHRLGLSSAGRVAYRFCFIDGISPTTNQECEGEIAGARARERVLASLQREGFHREVSGNRLFEHWVKPGPRHGDTEVDTDVWMRKLTPGLVYNREEPDGIEYKTVTEPATISGIQVSIEAG